jgi:bacteriocin-like protein
MELTMTTAINTNAKSERELTTEELEQVSGGVAPKKEAVFPTETIKFSYGAIEWTYTKS